MKWYVAACAALALVACGREVRRGTSAPPDTAAVFLPVDTAAGLSPESVPSPTAVDSAIAEPAMPVQIAAVDSAAGDSIFHGKGRCFTCHGQRGEGTPRLGSPLTEAARLADGGSLSSIRASIANGVPVPKAATVAMPAYSGALTPMEIARTAAYVYTLSHPDAVVADTAPAPPQDHAASAMHPTLAPDSGLTREPR